MLPPTGDGRAPGPCRKSQSSLGLGLHLPGRWLPQRPVLAQACAERPRRAGAPRPPVLPVLPAPSQLQTPSPWTTQLPPGHTRSRALGAAAYCASRAWRAVGFHVRGPRPHTCRLHSSLCDGLPVSTCERGHGGPRRAGHVCSSVVALPSASRQGPHLVPCLLPAVSLPERTVTSPAGSPPLECVGGGRAPWEGPLVTAWLRTRPGGVCTWLSKPDRGVRARRHG